MEGVPVVVDLEDFPHGGLSSVRKDSGYDIEFYDVPEGVRVSSYNEKTGLPEFRDVKFWSVHRGKKVEIVNLEDGRQIITDNDPRAVYGIAANGDSMTPGRFTPSDAMDKNVLVPVSDCPLASSVDGLSFDFQDGMIKLEKSGLCTEIGFGFGQFVGIMAGDGWADRCLNPYLSDNDGYNIAFVSDFLKTVFPDFTISKIEHRFCDESGRYGDTTAYRLNSGRRSILGGRIKELIDGHGDEKTSGSANKRLPVWFQFAGREFILGLVNGLIATDGTVCLSHSKEKPQLLISFSSTSIRLVREFRRCCQLLGVGSSISYSKRTSGGNDSWICSVSTVDAKRVDLLSMCCHSRKRDIFVSSHVDTRSTYVRNDVIPFPRGIAEKISRLIPTFEVSGSDEGSAGEDEMAMRRKVNSVAMNVRNRACIGTITRNTVRDIEAIGNEMAEKNTIARDNGLSVLADIESRFSGMLEKDAGGSRRSWKVSVSGDELKALSDGWNASKPRIAPTWSSDVRKSVNDIYIARKKGFLTWSQLGDIKALFSLYGSPDTELRDCAEMKALSETASYKVSWLKIKSVEKTGKEEIGYDLTVPGPDTFISDDGVVLSNTVNIHVPASDKAAKQSLEKMLPSENLISLTDMKSVRYKPEKEQISGLWALTRGRTKRPVRVFETKADAIRAYRGGEIGPNDPVEIKGV